MLISESRIGLIKSRNIVFGIDEEWTCNIKEKISALLLVHYCEWIRCNKEASTLVFLRALSLSLSFSRFFNALLTHNLNPLFVLIRF